MQGVWWRLRDGVRTGEAGHGCAGGVGDLRRSRIWLRRYGVIVALLLIAGGIGVLAAVVWLPPLLLDTRGIDSAADRAKAINDFRATLVTVLGGIAIGAGTVVAALNLRQNRRGQLTERFTKAVEQLGDARLDIRLGGIYALEGIARESRELHGPVIELLTAFLREHASEKTETSDEDSTAATAAGAGVIPAVKPARIPYLRADFKAIATVLSRRDVTHDARDETLNLSETRLNNASFFRAPLQGASFGGAQLRGADFVRAQLNEAEFTKAHLQGANFSGAKLHGTSFMFARLQGSIFFNAKLRNVSFAGADLEGAQFRTSGGDNAEGLTRDQLLLAIHVERATLPSYLAELPQAIAAEEEDK